MKALSKLSLSLERDLERQGSPFGVHPDTPCDTPCNATSEKSQQSTRSSECGGPAVVHFRNDSLDEDLSPVEPNIAFGVAEKMSAMAWCPQPKLLGHPLCSPSHDKQRQFNNERLPPVPALAQGGGEGEARGFLFGSKCLQPHREGSLELLSLQERIRRSQQLQEQAARQESFPAFLACFNRSRELPTELEVRQARARTF